MLQACAKSDPGLPGPRWSRQETQNSVGQWDDNDDDDDDDEDEYDDEDE